MDYRTRLNILIEGLKETGNVSAYRQRAREAYKRGDDEEALNLQLACLVYNSKQPWFKRIQLYETFRAFFPKTKTQAV